MFIVDTEERQQSVWSARSAFLEAIKASTTEMDECDVVVPRDKVADFIIYTHRLAKDLDIRIPSFGHAGDGNMHVYVCRDALDEKTSGRKNCSRAFDLMYQKVRGTGGTGFRRTRHRLCQKRLYAPAIRRYASQPDARH